MVGEGNLQHEGYGGPPSGIVLELKRMLQGGRMSLFGQLDLHLPWLRHGASFYVKLRALPVYKDNGENVEWPTAWLQLRPSPGPRSGTVSWQLLYTLELKTWEEGCWKELVSSGAGGGLDLGAPGFERLLGPPCSLSPPSPAAIPRASAC